MEFRNKLFVRRLIASLLVTFALSDGVWSAGQTGARQTSPPAHTLLLKEGTEVKLKMRDKLTSKTAVEGDPVNLILDQDLKVGEATVARAGSVAVGTVLTPIRLECWAELVISA